MQRPLESKHHHLTTAGLSCALVAALAAGSGSCGKTARQDGLTGGVAHASTKKNNLRSGKLAGSWRWSHLSDKKSVRRVELEKWVLSHTGNDQVRGHYDREVTFMSLDGVPFQCSQSLRYRLTTRYSLHGTYDQGKLNLKEVKYQSSNSPCDTGQRKLSSYGGDVKGDALVLTWAGGSQTLTRASTEISPPSRAKGEAKATTSGTWRWQNRRKRTTDTEVRVESEEWKLTENRAGTITGLYERSVTVFTQNGKTYACNGNTFYKYKDTYTVRGSRNGTKIILSEINSIPAQSECIAHKKRHLDAATGTLKGDFLVLEWRGKHKQILHR